MPSILRGMFSVNSLRLGWINLARGIIIIMVVYRHCLEGIRNTGFDMNAYKTLDDLNNLMFTFRMPLFFALSGILMNITLKKWGLKEFISKRIQLILYPYVIWAIIQITLQLLFSRYVNDAPGFESYIYILYDPRKIQQFWYLLALFNIGVIYALLKVRLKVPQWLHLIIALAFLLIFQYNHHNQVYLFFINDILAHYIYFAFGDILPSFVMNDGNRKKLSSPVTLLAILPFFLVFNYFCLKDLDRLYSLLIIPTSIAGITLIIVLSFIMEKYKAFDWLKILGENSLYIYLMHIIIMAANRTILVKVFHVDSVPVILYTNLFVALLLPVVIHHISVRSGFWWLFTPVKPKTARLPGGFSSNQKISAA